jgi:NAD(P)-dependent dehydrogenase (short-subunit alcohol dehydrogenase family)
LSNAPRAAMIGPMDLGLSGKVALVTGSSRGIGLATALAFAREGASVALSGRDAATLAKAGEKLRAAGGRHALCPGDVTDPAGAAAVVEAAAKQLGAIDILVNNVGGSAGGRRILDSTDEDWRAVLELNLVQTVRMIGSPRRRCRSAPARRSSTCRRSRAGSRSWSVRASTARPRRR